MTDIYKGDLVLHTAFVRSSENTTEYRIRNDGWSCDVEEEWLEVVERADDPANEDIADLKDRVQNNAIDIESLHQRVLHLETARYGEKSEEVPKLNPDFLAKGQAFERVQQDHARVLDGLARLEKLEAENGDKADRIAELEAKNHSLEIENAEVWDKNWQLQDRLKLSDFRSNRWHEAFTKERDRADTLSRMLRGMARRASNERRIGRLAEPKAEHPDLIDGDGDRWEWSRHHGAYSIANGLGDMATRDEMEMYYGPVKEAK